MMFHAGMWVSRPSCSWSWDRSRLLFWGLGFDPAGLGLGLSGLGLGVWSWVVAHNLRLCATATLLVSKDETSKWMCSIIYLFVLCQTDFDVFVHYYIYCSAIFKCRWMKTVCVCWTAKVSVSGVGLGLDHAGLGLGLPGLGLGLPGGACVRRRGRMCHGTMASPSLRS